MSRLKNADPAIRVLVVDDHDTTRKVWQRQLRNIGFQSVEIAADVYQAVDRVSAGDFDLVISDWRMKPVSGLEFLKMVRECSGGQAVKFVMLTDEKAGPTVDDSLASGADGFLPKPFNEASLAAAIDTLYG